MTEFLLTFVFLSLIVAAMAIGVLRGRAPIQGSCGGLNRLEINSACEICGGDPAKCDAPEPPAQAKGNFRDASS
ncbi:MAG: (Na+)-NQR maturation NqrM [Pseudomonadales bacterium]